MMMAILPRNYPEKKKILFQLKNIVPTILTSTQQVKNLQNQIKALERQLQTYKDYYVFGIPT